MFEGDCGYESGLRKGRQGPSRVKAQQLNISPGDCGRDDTWAILAATEQQIGRQSQCEHN